VPALSRFKDLRVVLPSPSAAGRQITHWKYLGFRSTDAVRKLWQRRSTGWVPESKHGAFETFPDREQRAALLLRAQACLKIRILAGIRNIPEGGSLFSSVSQPQGLRRE